MALIQIAFEPSGEPGAQALAPLFESNFFHPVALGAVHSARGGEDFLLAGAALESFVSKLSPRQSLPPRSVRFLGPVGQEGLAYRGRMEAFLRERRAPQRDLSPFERVGGGLTWYDGPELAVESLGEVDEWLADFPRAGVYCYGTLRAALTGESEEQRATGDGEAHRIVFPSDTGHLGAPLLVVTLELGAPSADLCELRLSSEAPLWMYGAGRASGLVGEREAEHNLQRLAALAHSLVKACPSPPTWSGLTLDDRTLAEELSRIRPHFPFVSEIC